MPAAIRHYRVAAGRTTSIPEQRYLTTKAARLARKRDTRSDSPAYPDMAVGPGQ